jgi:hypothetical protein
VVGSAELSIKALSFVVISEHKGLEFGHSNGREN